MEFNLMTNDYKDEISNLIKVVRDLTYTMEGACELFVNTNKDLLSSKSIVETAIANKKLSDELERTQAALNIVEVSNDYLNNELKGNKQLIDELKQDLENCYFKNKPVNKALTDKDIADISAPLDLHGLHLNEDLPLENDLIKAQIDFINENVFSPRTNRLLKEANIHTISELAAKKDSELLSLKGFGLKCLKEVRNYLGV